MLLKTLDVERTHLNKTDIHTSHYLNSALIFCWIIKVLINSVYLIVEACIKFLLKHSLKKNYIISTVIAKVGWKIWISQAYTRTNKKYIVFKFCFYFNCTPFCSVISISNTVLWTVFVSGQEAKVDFALIFLSFP